MYADFEQFSKTAQQKLFKTNLYNVVVLQNVHLGDAIFLHKAKDFIIWFIKQTLQDLRLRFWPLVKPSLYSNQQEGNVRIAISRNNISPQLVAQQRCMTS